MKLVQIIVQESINLTGTPKAWVVGHCHVAPKNDRASQMLVRSEKYTEYSTSSSHTRSISLSNIDDSCAPNSIPNKPTGRKSP